MSFNATTMRGPHGPLKIPSYCLVELSKNSGGFPLVQSTIWKVTEPESSSNAGSSDVARPKAGGAKAKAPFIETKTFFGDLETQTAAAAAYLVSGIKGKESQGWSIVPRTPGSSMPTPPQFPPAATALPSSLLQVVSPPAAKKRGQKNKAPSVPEPSSSPPPASKKVRKNKAAAAAVPPPPPPPPSSSIPSPPPVPVSAGFAPPKRAAAALADAKILQQSSSNSSRSGSFAASSSSSSFAASASSASSSSSSSAAAGLKGVMRSGRLFNGDGTKFWELHVDATHGAITQSGNVGDVGRYRRMDHASAAEAKAYFDKKVQEKVQTGWKIQEGWEKKKEGKTGTSNEVVL